MCSVQLQVEATAPDGALKVCDGVEDIVDGIVAPCMLAVVEVADGPDHGSC